VLLCKFGAGRNEAKVKLHTTVTLVHDTDNLIIRDVPVTSTVVELPQDNLVIIDTGMAGNPQLAAWLDELGCHPEDISLVINTHLHPDHIGGNRLFTGARILVSRRELGYETDLIRRFQDTGDPVALLRSLGRKVDENICRLAWDWKRLAEQYPAPYLVGDSAQLEFLEDDPFLPSQLSFLKVPGHSIDSRAILLQGRRRSALVTGDAFYHRDLWRSVPFSGINYNDELYLKNAESLARFQGIIIPGHDHAFSNKTGRYLPEDTFSL